MYILLGWQRIVKIRQATVLDLDAVDMIEQACFPVAEAATRKSLKERLQAFYNKDGGWCG